MAVTWVYEELLLAAQLVWSNGWDGVRASRNEAQALSALLRRGQLHPGAILPGNFRSANSVQRKTYDISTRHPAYSGRRTHGGGLDSRVVEKFISNPSEADREATAIRQALESGEPLEIEANEQRGAEEGKLLLSVHLRRERDQGLRNAKLRDVRSRGGGLTCEVCGFDFASFYGARGDGYIEVHHVVPLYVIGPSTTELNDLSLVCSNCHRMCHREPWMRPEKLARLVAHRMHAQGASISSTSTTTRPKNVEGARPA